MKKIKIVLLLAFLPLFGISQSVFDKYENMENVGAVKLNKGLIQLAGNIAAFNTEDQDAQDFAEISKDIEDIKVFITEDVSISKDMEATIKTYLQSSNLEELMRVKDKDANMKFYTKSGSDEDHVSELLLFVSEINNDVIGLENKKFESILVSMTGNIDLNKIGALTKNLNLPEELNQANN